jgi:hypothetical protein
MLRRKLHRRPVAPVEELFAINSREIRLDRASNGLEFWLALSMAAEMGRS